MECKVSSRSVPDLVDITNEVEGVLSGSGIRDGQVTVFSPNVGCSLVVNEKESGLFEDIKRAMVRLDGRKLVGSSSLVLPVAEGKLRLGTWQRVLLVEQEEPTDRPVVVQIVGE